LLGLPLFLFYNKDNLVFSIKIGVAGFILSNLILFYPTTGMGFLNMVFDRGVGTALYAYAYIPLLTLLSLIVVNGKEIARLFSAKYEHLRHRTPKPSNIQKLN
jgi:hypothetical protein